MMFIRFTIYNNICSINIIIARTLFRDTFFIFLATRMGPIENTNTRIKELTISEYILLIHTTYDDEVIDQCKE